MNYVLFDGTVRRALLPFTFTRPVADIRFGILTIREKWEYYLGDSTTTDTASYLTKKYPFTGKKECIFINASYMPDTTLISAIMSLHSGQAIFDDTEIIAYFSTTAQKVEDFKDYEMIHFKDPVMRLRHVWNLFTANGIALQDDFDMLTRNRKSHPIPSNINVIAPEHIFIEAGAKLQFCTLNAATGPIYIGKNTEVMEGSLIRGSFALCEGAIVKAGAKIYGATTIGPYCKIGGEVYNSVLFGYSNKAHDGFLGNSVLGEWCNLGANTNTSNLKNTYKSVRLWSYESESFRETVLQFCGLIMGDHSKCGINTMFNTGTVVGVSANIYGSGFPDNFIPGFSWGGADGFTTYRIKEAVETAKIVMSRRHIEFTKEDAAILTHIFEETKRWRKE